MIDRTPLYGEGGDHRGVFGIGVTHQKPFLPSSAAMTATDNIVATTHSRGPGATLALPFRRIEEAVKAYPFAPLHTSIIPSSLGIHCRHPPEPAMAHPTFDHGHAAHTAMEVRIDRDGPGPRRWRWSIWRGETLIARSPAGFTGAEEAFEAGRRALHQPRPRSEPSGSSPAPWRR